MFCQLINDSFCIEYCIAVLKYGFENLFYKIVHLVVDIKSGFIVIVFLL